MNAIREDLKAFVDGELSAARMEEVRLAVASDPSLQQEVDDMRLLGFEIKRMATEPAVVGKEAVLDKVRRPKAPWWDASRLSGRLAYSGLLFFVLAGVSIGLFPFFSSAQNEAATASSPANKDAMAPAANPELTDGFSESGTNQVPSGGGVGGTTTGGTGGGGGFSANPAPGDERERFGRGMEAEDSPETLEYRSSVAPSGSSPRFGGKGEMEGQVYSAEEQPPLPESKVSESADAKAKARPEGPRRTLPQTSAKPNTNTSVPSVHATTRMVVKNADIDLKVENAKRALEEAEDLAKKLGGYSEGGSLTSMEGQTPHASCVLRVRSDLYETAMKALRGMGEVLNETSNANDVTAVHADTVGRLTVLRAEADSYVTMLRAARKIGEIMEIKDRLSQVRQEIASLEAQRKALQNESSLSTIRATFNQKESVEKAKEKDESGFDETWAKAMNGLSKFGEFLGNAAIYIFVFSPVWLPPVLLFWWLGKKARA